MNDCLIKFFKDNKGRYQVRRSEIKKFYFDYYGFKVSNPNQYYLFLNQINCFLIDTLHHQTKVIDWDFVNKHLFKKKE